MACFIGKNVLIKALTREVHGKGERVVNLLSPDMVKRGNRKKSHNLFDYKWASVQSVHDRCRITTQTQSHFWISAFGER